ncbi:chlorite dismutase family protein [Luedemannella flava]
MAAPLTVSFTAGLSGPWRIDSVRPVVGEVLPIAVALSVSEGATAAEPGVWSLRGTMSNLRYTTVAERTALVARQEGLGRAPSTRAALIPIRKTQAWWDLAQDERREILEERSRHIAIGLRYLPAVARRLHHSRDLGEPFDFLTWFEFAPAEADAFEELVASLRATPEWAYVDREVDVRLSHD